MIPIGDNLPQRSRPIITYGLIGLSIGLFFWELQLETPALSDFLQTWAVVPVKMTALVQDAIAGRFLALPFLIAPLLVSLFLHQGWAHLLGNLLFLRVFGARVEATLGHGAFLAFFVVTGILTRSLQVLLDPASQAAFVGANGAIAAVLSAYLTSFPRAKIDSILPLIVIFLPIELPAWVYLFGWVGQQIISGWGSFSLPDGINPLSVTGWGQAIGLLLGAVWVKPKLRNTQPAD